MLNKRVKKKRLKDRDLKKQRKKGHLTLLFSVLLLSSCKIDPGEQFFWSKLDSNFTGQALFFFFPVDSR